MSRRAAYGESALEPQAVAGSADFAWIGAGDAYTCALTTAGRAQCWGSGNRDELGRQVGVCGTVAGFQNHCTPIPGEVNHRPHPPRCRWATVMSAASRLPAPLAISGDPRYRAIAGGDSHVCALTEADAAHCWGNGRNGQLGSGGRLP